jgi:hypothetical protein
MPTVIPAHAVKMKVIKIAPNGGEIVRPILNNMVHRTSDNSCFINKSINNLKYKNAVK